MSKAVFWIAMLSLSAWIAWMAADNDYPYRYKDWPESKIIPSVARPGQTVLSDWTFTKPVRRTCPATIQRFYTDTDSASKTFGKTYTGDITAASLAVKIGDSGLARYFDLPPYLPPQVDYGVQICWQCNLYQQFVQPLCMMTPKLPLTVR